MGCIDDKGYRITKLATTGGFQKGNTALLIGVEEEDLDELLSIIEKTAERNTTTTQVIQQQKAHF